MNITEVFSPTRKSYQHDPYTVIGAILVCYTVNFVWIWVTLYSLAPRIVRKKVDSELTNEASPYLCYIYSMIIAVLVTIVLWGIKALLT